MSKMAPSWTLAQLYARLAWHGIVGEEAPDAIVHVVVDPRPIQRAARHREIESPKPI